MLPLSDLSRLTGIKHATLRLGCTSGALEHERIGSLYVSTVEAVERWRARPETRGRKRAPKQA